MELKAKGALPPDVNLQLLAGAYLASIEQIVQAIDQHLHPEPQ